MRSRAAAAALLSLGLIGAACGSEDGSSRTDAICRRYAELAEQAGMILAEDGSDIARCSKTQERRRRKLGDSAYAVHAGCLLRARSIVEWMACDPRERDTPAQPTDPGAR